MADLLCHFLGDGRMRPTRPDVRRSARTFLLFGLACLGLFAGGAIARAAEAAKSNPTTASKSRTFAEVVKDHFWRWDADRDGRLETAELDDLVNRPTIHGEEAAALATIKRRQRMAIAAKVKDFSISREELENGVDRAPSAALDSARTDEPAFKFTTSYRNNVTALSNINHKLYAGDGPNFESLRQGAIGDCFFFSVVGNLAAHQPQKILRMIRADSSGRFIVHFPDGDEVRVTKPTDVEILVNNSRYSIADGLWITILEKAAGTRLQNKVAAHKQTEEETDAISMGGSTGGIIGLMTGRQTQRIALRDREHEKQRLAELREALPKALAAHRLVGVSMSADPPAGGEKIPKLGYKHSYALFEYRKDTDMVTLWNPWGNTFTPKDKPGVAHGFETKHGVFHLPLKTLYEQFSSVVIETDKKIESPASPAEKLPAKKKSS